MAWFSRLRGMFRKEDLAREQDEELQFHLAMREQWNVDQGLKREEARRDARVRLGNAGLWRERMSEIDLMMLPETFLQDVRYGARMLWRNAGFTAGAVVALALGIGINTVALTAYKAFVGKRVEARDPEQIVDLGAMRHGGYIDSNFSYPDYEAYRDQLHSFSGVIAAAEGESMILSDAGAVVSQRNAADESLAGKLGLLPPGASNKEFAGTAIVSENYFALLGVNLLRGRGFGSAQNLAAAPAVLVSENYWQKRFGGDPALLGKTVRLNGIAFTVVGLTPHDFAGTAMSVPDFWLPMSLLPLLHPDSNPLRDRENQHFKLFGRLAPGVTMSEAQAEMTLLAVHLDTLHTAHSIWNNADSAVLWPGSPLGAPVELNKGFNYTMRLIMVAVIMVLVIACANVASLQLARSTSRQNELVMRLSLGASRIRIIRQLLTECALLGVIAGMVALFCSWAMMKVLVTLIAEAFPPEYGTVILSVTPDLKIFACVFGLSLAASVLFGLAPAVESSGAAFATAMKVNKGTPSARSRRARDLFIGAQVAVSVVLLISGGMLIHSSIHALRTDPGYDIQHAIQLDLQLPEASGYSADRRSAVVREVRTRLAALAGVGEVTAGDAPLFGYLKAAVSLNGERPSAQNTEGEVFYRFVEPNYLETLGIQVVAGRGFTLQAVGAERTAIVSETVARMMWPGQNPIGRRVRLAADGFHAKSELLPDGPSYEVIGVARDTLGTMPDGSDIARVYVPLPADRAQYFPILIHA
ncbi:MAG: ABC transporter permease, partial [Terracidiphilus sp.]